MEFELYFYILSHFSLKNRILIFLKLKYISHWVTSYTIYWCWVCTEEYSFEIMHILIDINYLYVLNSFWLDAYIISTHYLDLDIPTLNITTSSPYEGDNITLTCIAYTNDPITEYAFFHDDGEIHKGRSPLYQISDGNRTNSGVYKCTVKTEYPLVKSSAEKTITYLCKYYD